MNLIKKRFDLIFFKTKVHENKRQLNYERECKVLTTPLFAQQWLIRFNPEIHSMHVINKQETTLLKK
jgi:hypothetical protein